MSDPGRSGYQPRNTPAERRAFFDLQRQIEELQRIGGLNILGRVPTVGDLPATGNPGDGWITDDPPDHLWVWQAEPPPGQWVDTGPFNVTDHNALSGVTANQHHSQAHVHNGGDGSGLVQHSSLLGLTPNNHHNQAHLLHGPDHTDVASGITPLQRHVHAYFNGLWTLEYRMNWQGVWAPGTTYETHDVVYDDSWLMIANTQTVERAAPQPTGDPFNVYTGTSPTRQDVAKQIRFGNRYTFQQGAYITGWRVWTVVGNIYTIYVIDDPEGAAVIQELGQLTGSGGWQEFSVGEVIVTSGSVLDLIAIVQEPDPSPITFQGDWDYDTPNNPTVPLTGQIVHANSATSEFRIHKFDNGGTDRSADLATVAVGDLIQGPNVQWAVQAIADNGTWINFAVAPATQDSPDGVATFTFEVVTPTPITHVEDFGYWPTTAYSVQGILRIDDGAEVISTNAYGTDLTVQLANISSDWDLMSKVGGSSGGGDGGTPGPPGEDGSVWYDGAGAPAGALGVDGDYYLDTDTGDVYTKAAGAWSVTGNIAGPQGVPGDPGPEGPSAVSSDAANAAILGTDDLIYVPAGGTNPSAFSVTDYIIWAYASSTPPGDGNFSFQFSDTQINFGLADFPGNERDYLASMHAGAILVMVDPADPFYYRSWRLDADLIDAGGWLYADITPLEDTMTVNGRWPPAANKQFQFSFHAATGFDGDHANLTNVLPDQHHAEIHDLDSHSDVNAANPGGQNVLTWSDLDQAWQPRAPLASLNLAAFAYRFDSGLTGPAASGDIVFNNADPALVTELYISETDGTNQDVALFLEYLTVGSWCNVGDRDDYQAQHHAYDVIGAPIDNGTWWTIPVAVFENVGAAFSNNQQINLVTRYVTEAPEISHDGLIGVTPDQHHNEIHTVGSHSDVNTESPYAPTEGQALVFRSIDGEGVWIPETVGDPNGTGFVLKTGDTMSGELTVDAVGSIDGWLNLKDTSQPTNARPYLSIFGGTDGARKMYIGYPDTANDGVRVVAEDGDLLLQSVTGDVLLNDGYWGNVSALPTAWTNITTWSNNWKSYGGVWQAPQYRKHMDTVELRGLARNDGTLARYGTIFTLPTGHRPVAQLIFPVQANLVGGGGSGDDHQSRVTIYSTGIVRLEGTVDAGASWLSLNISFSVV